MLRKLLVTSCRKTQQTWGGSQVSRYVDTCVLQILHPIFCNYWSGKLYSGTFYFFCQWYANSVKNLNNKKTSALEFKATTDWLGGCFQMLLDKSYCVKICFWEVTIANGIHTCTHSSESNAVQWLCWTGTGTIMNVAQIF